MKDRDLIEARILLLCHLQKDNAATIRDHINSIENHTGLNVTKLNMRGELPLSVNLNNFHAVIVHYSLILSKDDFISPFSRNRLRLYEGLKIVFIQDEYRWVNKAVSALKYIKADILYSCIPESEHEKVYPKKVLPRLEIKHTLTGYVPSELLNIKRKGFLDRAIDVGYRGRTLSAAYGRLAKEKREIAPKFKRHVKDSGLIIDLAIDESSRLYGENWINFILNCKSMLGVESGASVFDFNDTIISAVQMAESKGPSLTFEQLEEKFFPGLDGQIKINQISPRCFECAALGTLMVLYEGDYSGALIPWRHYVPLKKDFSNIAEVLNYIRNEKKWNYITERAYDEVACNPLHSYKTFGLNLGNVIVNRLKYESFIIDESPESCQKLFLQDENRENALEIKKIENIENNMVALRQALSDKLHQTYEEAKKIIPAFILSYLKPLIKLCIIPLRVVGKTCFKILQIISKLSSLYALFESSMGSQDKKNKIINLRVFTHLAVGFFSGRTIKLLSELEHLDKLKYRGKTLLSLSGYPCFMMTINTINRHATIQFAPKKSRSVCPSFVDKSGLLFSSLEVTYDDKGDEHGLISGVESKRFPYTVGFLSIFPEYAEIAIVNKSNYNMWLC